MYDVFIQKMVCDSEDQYTNIRHLRGRPVTDFEHSQMLNKLLTHY